MSVQIDNPFDEITFKMKDGVTIIISPEKLLSLLLEIQHDSIDILAGPPYSYYPSSTKTTIMIKLDVSQVAMHFVSLPKQLVENKLLSAIDDTEN